VTEETPVTKHVNECVKILNKWLWDNPPSEQQAVDRNEALESVFELVCLPWDEGTEEDVDFREGYETCLLDIVNAIADEWGVKLPELKVK
jgi:hypothetical protein